MNSDPYVQMPDHTQNFNRYSCGLNNPLKFTDQDAEFIPLLVIAAAAVIGVCVRCSSLERNKGSRRRLELILEGDRIFWGWAAAGAGAE